MSKMNLSTTLDLATTYKLFSGRQISQSNLTVSKASTTVSCPKYDAK